ncbi:MAG: hypothetical protein CSA66_06650 [Proteobacteria bacterium]|nr:MAG: hypothetical protein CSA66_06650 [Pseudomonadota bacterium]
MSSAPAHRVEELWADLELPVAIPDQPRDLRVGGQHDLGPAEALDGRADGDSELGDRHPDEVGARAATAVAEAPRGQDAAAVAVEDEVPVEADVEADVLARLIAGRLLGLVDETGDHQRAAGAEDKGRVA